MVQKLIDKCLETIKLTAFYEHDHVYRVDEKILKINEKELKEVLSQLTQSYDYETNEYEVASAYHELLDTFKDTINTYLAYLKTIAIPETEFDEYMKNHVSHNHIKEYHQQQQAVINAGVSVYYFENQNDYQYYIDNFEPDEMRPTQSHSYDTVLNHNNPFADVHIQNQAFLYPNTDNHYTTLRFQLGHQMTKMEHLDDELLVLKPNFKIEQSSSRDVTDQPVTFDDTITQRMPEDNNNKALFYI